MRIFLPLQTEDRHRLGSTAPGTGSILLPLSAGRPAWSVSPWARAERAAEDPEDLEYDALQDAAYAALVDEQDPSGPQGRRAVLAGDVPDTAVREASETGGAFGVEIVADAQLRLAALHVTEQGAAAALADDTDPALLWFDAVEPATALDYLEGRSA